MIIKFALTFYYSKFIDFCMFFRNFKLALYKLNYLSFLAIIFIFLAEICIDDELELIIELGVKSYVSSIFNEILIGVFKL